MTERRDSPAGLAAAAIIAVILLLCAAEGWCEEVPLSHDAGPLVLAASADLLSTRYALSRGSRELNPLGQTEARRVALKAVTTAGVTYGVRRLRSSGHPGRARALKYSVLSLQVLAAGWNVRNARRVK